MYALNTKGCRVKTKTQTLRALCMWGLLCASVVGIHVSCVSASSAAAKHTKTQLSKAPAWVTDAAAVYPDSLYLSAVGYSEQRSGAEMEAAAALTKSISQKVASETSAAQSMEKGSPTVKKSVSSVVRTVSQVDKITGLTVKETWTAPDGTEYALAVINREEVGSYYAQKIRNCENGINKLIVFASEHPAGFEAVSALSQAVENAAENERDMAVLSVVHPAKYKLVSLAYENKQAVEVLLRREIEKIRIAVDVKSDVKADVKNVAGERLTAAFMNVLNEAGFASSVKNAAPYVLAASFSATPFETANASDTRFVRYMLNVQLSDTRTGKTVLSWSTGGKEAHLSESEAVQRAVRTAETEIKNSFLEHLLKLS